MKIRRNSKKCASRATVHHVKPPSTVQAHVELLSRRRSSGCLLLTRFRFSDERAYLHNIGFSPPKSALRSISGIEIFRQSGGEKSEMTNLYPIHSRQLTTNAV